MPAAADFAEGYSAGDILAGAAQLFFFVLVAAAIAYDGRERRVPNGLALAVTAAVMRRPSLPLMPFFGSAFLILWIATML